MTPQKTFASSPLGPHLESGEQGYLLLGVLVMVMLVTLSLAVAAPVIATEVRREKEAELYHRGLQYSRAVRLYYKQFGRYPLTVDQLEDTNKVRYLRKRYVDPITGQEFRIIHVGEARLQVPGFYGGDPIIANNPGSPTTPIAGGVPGTNPGTSRYGSSGNSSGSSNSSFGSSGISFVSSSNPFGSSSSSPGGTSGSSGSPGSPNGPGGSSSGSGIGGGFSFGSSSTSTPGSDPSSSGPAAAGQTLGGLGIIGVSSRSSRDSIRVYRKQTKYDRWEFVYDASQEELGATGIGPLQPFKSPNSVNGGTDTTSGGVTQPATPPVNQASPQD